MEAESQRQLSATAASIADLGGCRKTAYELCSDEERILMIGGDYNSAGQAFVEANRDQVRWLESRGVMLEDAAERARVWLAKTLDDHNRFMHGPE